MNRIIVAGCGTDVGKTVVSAILTTCFDGEYWKPVQCGQNEIPIDNFIHRPSYYLEHPLSPHHAARLEQITIDPSCIIPPQTTKPLIIESVGGVLVPLTSKMTTLDLFQHWKGQWIIVSQHYLGSINHTLLTIEALKQRKISIAGIIFNGEPNCDSEAAILEISQLPMLARLLPEPIINKKTIQKYAKLWKPHLVKKITNISGIPLLK